MANASRNGQQLAHSCKKVCFKSEKFTTFVTSIEQEFLRIYRCVNIAV